MKQCYKAGVCCIIYAMTENGLTKYLKTAFEYKNSGEYKKAADYFYKALAIENESTEIMRELAFLYSKLCRYDRSMSLCEQILQKNPGDNEAKFELAKLLKLSKDYKRAEKILLDLYGAGFKIEETARELFYILICEKRYGKIITSFNKYSKELKTSSVLYYAALAHAALGNKYTADEYFKKSFKSDERNIRPGIEIAESFFQKGRKDEARALALKLLKYSEDAGICALLAEIEYSDGNIDNAAAYYSYAIKLNPQKAEYYFKIAVLFSLKGFFKEAEEGFCKAVNLDGGNELYNYSLAYMYYITGKYDLAGKIADFLLELNPDNIKAAALKILIPLKNNKNQPVLKLADKLERAKDKDAFEYYALSVYYAGLNLWAKAASAVSEALRLNKTSNEYNYQLAVCSYHLGRISEAGLICDKIINSSPKYLQAYLLLSRICLLNKNYQKAQMLLDKAAGLDKNNDEIYCIKAEVYYTQQDYNKSLEYYKTALSISPGREEYYSKTAQCCYNLKNYSEAYYYYREAAEINMTKAEYRYYAAKCAELTGKMESAASNYSFAKRLAPNNALYIKDYAKFLNKTNRKKEAVKLFNQIKKELPKKEIEEMEELLKKKH